MKQSFVPNSQFSSTAYISTMEKYKTMYEKSINKPNEFWQEQAKRITWYESWNTVSDHDFINGSIEWFKGGKLNASYNCIDRHIENGYGEDIAIIWEGNNPNQSRKFTYNELLKEVCQFSNALKDLGVKKGDRVCLYMQMIPELAIALLACARIGAVHSVVFGAFSSESLRDRINDSKCKILVTQDTGVRGKKQNINMKSNADSAALLMTEIVEQDFDIFSHVAEAEIGNFEALRETIVTEMIEDDSDFIADTMAQMMAVSGAEMSSYIVNEITNFEPEENEIRSGLRRLFCG